MNIVYGSSHHLNRTVELHCIIHSAFIKQKIIICQKSGMDFILQNRYATKETGCSTPLPFVIIGVKLV